MSLRTYEALFIVSPLVEDDDVHAIARETETLITKSGGAIVRSEVWGRRRLAYKVKKFVEGIYVLIRFQAPPNFVARLENYLRLNEQIIRYLIVYLDEKTLKLEAEQQRIREEMLASGFTPPSEKEEDDEDNLAPISSRSTKTVEDEEEED